MKDWTLEEAKAANAAALLENPERNDSDPTLPIFQWFALHELDNLHARYKQGEKFALMLAIRQCANHDLVMPPWVATAYIKVFDVVLNCNSKDWNEVFGNPIPKGAQLNALRQKRRLKFAVFNEVNDILKRDPSRAIDGILFDEVGEKFGISKTLADEYYYSVKKILPISIKNKNPTKL
ncbi:MAG: hypothetical protein Q7T35_10255 [Nitrosomonas sp.]|nr:hypothetical protein [Nitrosomonas sp.]